MASSNALDAAAEHTSQLQVFSFRLVTGSLAVRPHATLAICVLSLALAGVAVLFVTRMTSPIAKELLASSYELRLSIELYREETWQAGPGSR